MRCPPALALSIGLALGACEPGATVERERGGARAQRVHVGERAVLEGEVVERLDTDCYVYLRLSIIRDSAAPGLAAYTRMRWVAVDGHAPALGERLRARSLARRSHVWVPKLERDFEVLEYVALWP